MSEIPFVNLLGDALEGAARRSPAPRRRRKRFALFALTGAIALSGTAAATGLFSDHAEQLATTPVSCYATADAERGRVTFDSVPDTSEIGRLSAVELCRRELANARAPVTDLVACSGPANVAVIPGRSAADCTAAGFAPLSSDYARAQARTAKLERDLLQIEASADCIDPATFADRVQAMLDRSGWAGWTTRIVGSFGWCGTLSGLNGGGQRTFGGAYDTATRQVMVRRVASRRVMDLLYSKRSSLLGLLMRESGARCLTVAALRARTKAVFAARGIDATLRATRYTFPAGASLDDEDGRFTRYHEGCAIVTSAWPGTDNHSVRIDAWLKP